MRTERKVLRRLVLVAAASAALFMGASPAQADNGPHVSTATTTATTGVKISDAGQGRCASCHRAHTAKSAYLLNAASEEALCFSCHGGSGTGATTDVENGVGYDAASSTTYPDGTVQTVARGAQVGALRGGGFEQAMLGTDQATKEIYFNTSRSLVELEEPADPPSRRSGGDDVEPLRWCRHHVGQRLSWHCWRGQGHVHDGDDQARVLVLPRPARQQAVPDPRASSG